VKRRDVLSAIAGIGSISVTVGLASAQPLALSIAAVEELLRAHGLDPLPGEPAQVRAMLLSTRLRSMPDPRIEPAIRLDPELD
jgi:hypothetical protein